MVSAIANAGSRLLVPVSAHDTVLARDPTSRGHVSQPAGMGRSEAIQCALRREAAVKGIRFPGYNECRGRLAAILGQAAATGAQPGLP